jgi:hypothetical protein
LFELLLDERAGQRRVPEVVSHLLSIGERPFHEVHHDARLTFVLVILVQEDPRK